MSVDEARIIELPKFLDVRGNLSFAEQYTHIPFEIRRVYWLYDVPGGIARGGHAEKNNEELIIALSGAFEIVIDDGKRSKTFVLNRSYYGLYIPKGLWREIKLWLLNLAVFHILQMTISEITIVSWSTQDVQKVIFQFHL